MAKRLLVVDDDTEIRELLEFDLSHSGYSVDTAKNGLEGLNKALNNTYDLVLLDVMMPKMNGFEVCQNIRKTKKNLPILLLTAKGTIDDKTQGFDCGADDYLVKPFEIEELKLRVRALLKRGNTLLPSLAKPEILALGDLTLDPDNLTVTINSKTAKLTPTEFDIINILMQHNGQTVPSAIFLKEIWGYSEDDDVEMVRVHVRHLRSKIEKIAPKSKYIQTVYGGGYKLNPTNEN